MSSIPQKLKPESIPEELGNACRFPRSAGLINRDRFNRTQTPRATSADLHTVYDQSSGTGCRRFGMFYSNLSRIESVILLRHYQTSRVGATGHELAISYTRLPTPMIQPFKIDDRKMGVLKMLYR